MSQESHEISTNCICVIAPYFGSLPKTFDIWLHSAKNNPHIDFHLVGDCFLNIVPLSNVYVHIKSFLELNELITSKLHARSLADAYKLCDFKPTYSVLFTEIASGYKIWGFSDLDLIYGDIIGTVNFSDLPQKWGRIFDLGHLSFFPNAHQINHAFELKQGALNAWPYIRDSRVIWVFDEQYSDGLGGVNENIQKLGYEILRKNEVYSDVLPQRQGFFTDINIEADNLFFLYSENRLFEVHIDRGLPVKREICYVHLQKRKYQVCMIDTHTHLIVPEHWRSPTSIAEALEFLRKYRNSDLMIRRTITRTTWSRWKKWLTFLLECFHVNRSFTAFLLLFNFYIKRIHTNLFIRHPNG